MRCSWYICCGWYIIEEHTRGGSPEAKLPLITCRQGDAIYRFRAEMRTHEVPVSRTLFLRTMMA